MDSQTMALIRRYATGAAVAALGGALGALTTILDSLTTQASPAPPPGVIALACLAGAVTALRLWGMKQMSGFASIIGVEKSLGDKLAASPALAGSDDDAILYAVMVPPVEPVATTRLGLMAAAPSLVEVRKFSDPRLQEAIEHVFQNTGGKNGMFFNVNLDGEVRSGVAVKVGGHLSTGGFLVKKPGLKLEGLAEVTYAF